MRKILIFAFASACYAQQAKQPDVMRLDQTEMLQMQLLVAQQENIRLSVCLRNGVTAAECGGWEQGVAIKRIPKPGEVAERPPNPAAMPMTKPGDPPQKKSQ